MATITLKNLSKMYTPDAPAVADLNLTVLDGELMVLLGPSGAGKTTILRLIAGLLRPSHGDVLFNGHSVNHLPPEKRGAVMVFQEHTLFPFMSVGDNIAFGLRMQHLPDASIQRKVAQALQAVQMTGYEDYWPDQLSGGQGQRVALARALVTLPQVLLLDEPLSDLDQNLRTDIRNMISKIQRSARITTLFITHDQTEAVAIADRITLLLAGRIRQVGKPNDFFDRPVDAEVARFFGGRNFLHGFKKGGTVDTQIGPLVVSKTNHDDGDVLLTIRPEAVQIGAHEYNNLQVKVTGYRYRGAVVHCTFELNGFELYASVPPHQCLAIGDNITVHIPRDRIRILAS